MSIELKPETPYVIVSVVTPETDDPSTSGRIVNFPCAPTVTHEMLMRVDDTWMLQPKAAAIGYVTVKDLYQQERNGAGWDAWQAHVASWQGGKRFTPFPREKLPREVLRRQACGETDEALALELSKKTAPVTGKIK